MGSNTGSRRRGVTVAVVATVALLVLAASVAGGYILARLIYPATPVVDAPTPTLSADVDMVPTPTPESQASATETAGATPAPDATLTAACVLFDQQFPGTPCPPASVEGLDATATAACSLFSSQFPGTPCP